AQRHPRPHPETRSRVALRRMTRTLLGRRLVLGGLATLPLLRPELARAETRADRILVLKSRRLLRLMAGSTTLASFPIALGKNPIGRKRRSGDNRTPEGEYIIDGRSWPNRFHRALHLSYPNDEDAWLAEAHGWDPGGNICIHGLPEGFEDLDPQKF